MERSGKLHATTVIGVIHNGEAAIGSDGQATMDKTVMKANVRKVRRLYNGQILAGFAGSTADSLTLFEKFEEKISAKKKCFQEGTCRPPEKTLASRC